MSNNLFTFSEEEANQLVRNVLEKQKRTDIDELTHSIEYFTQEMGLDEEHYIVKGLRSRLAEAQNRKIEV